MSKAIGNIFALGLAPEPNDEEKERLEQLSRQAQAYAQNAKPLEGEDFRNSADKYLRILENASKNDNSYPVVREDKQNQFNSGVENLVKATQISKDNDTVIGQVLGATQDLGESYINMINANLKSSQAMQDRGTTIDNYYHWIGNYNAADRGNIGAATAATVGIGREISDYIKNLSDETKTLTEINRDFMNDLAVNRNGREMAQSNSYNSALEACEKYRPEEYDPMEKWKYYRKRKR